jgi:hypothetical protein
MLLRLQAANGFALATPAAINQHATTRMTARRDGRGLKHGVLRTLSGTNGQLK